MRAEGDRWIIASKEALLVEKAGFKKPRTKVAAKQELRLTSKGCSQ